MKITCTDCNIAESINIIIALFVASFLTILFLYILRFGYEGAPTLVENILITVLPTIIVFLCVYRRISYHEPNGKNHVYKSIIRQRMGTL